MNRTAEIRSGAFQADRSQRAGSEIGAPIVWFMATVRGSWAKPVLLDPASPKFEAKTTYEIAGGPAAPDKFRAKGASTLLGMPLRRAPVRMCEVGPHPRRSNERKVALHFTAARWNEARPSA